MARAPAGGARLREGGEIQEKLGRGEGASAALLASQLSSRPSQEAIRDSAWAGVWGRINSKRLPCWWLKGKRPRRGQGLRKSHCGTSAAGFRARGAFGTRMTASQRKDCWPRAASPSPRRPCSVTLRSSAHHLPLPRAHPHPRHQLPARAQCQPLLPLST